MYVTGLTKLANAYVSLCEKTADNNDGPSVTINEGGGRVSHYDDPMSTYFARKNKEEMAPSLLEEKYEDVKDYLRDGSNLQDLAIKGGIGLGALGLASAVGSSGAHSARNKMLAAGMTQEEMDNVLSTEGAVARTLGNSALGGLAGSLGGYGLGAMADAALNTDDTVDANQHALANALATVGGLGGAAYGAYRSHRNEGRRAAKAIHRKKIKALESRGKGRRRTKKAALLDAGAGILGHLDARKRMEAAGMSPQDMNEVSSMGGAAFRGIGRGMGYGLGGALGGGVLGAGLGAIGGDAALGTGLGSLVGSLAGTGYGLYRGYENELDLADEAIRKLEKEASYLL